MIEVIFSVVFFYRRFGSRLILVSEFFGFVVIVIGYIVSYKGKVKVKWGG